MDTKLTLLAQATRSIREDMPVTDQMQQFARQICDFFAADACVIRVLEGNQLLLIANEGISTHLLNPSISTDSGLALHLISTKAPKAIPDVTRDSETWFFNSRPGGYKFLSYAGAPLLAGDKVVGILGVYSSQQPRDYSPEDLLHLQILANYAAVVLSQHHLIESLREEKVERDSRLAEALDRADRDPLTGLLNHHSYYDHLHRLATETEGFAVVLMDLDNFKFFNDAFGHNAGDRVLEQISERLLTFAGTEALVARLGGDEFALILPNELPEARHLLETRLAKEILRTDYLPLGYAVEIPIRLSAGIAYYPADSATVMHLMHIADERLFQNKYSSSQGVGTRIRESMIALFPNFGILDALVTSLDTRDRYSRKHSEEVFFYAGLISEQLGMSEREQELLSASALLLDVGKIAVSDRILRMPSLLGESDFNQIKMHPELGAMLTEAAGMPELAPAIRYHHEAWDGSGYPFGLIGEAIPLSARILAVADAYSAMTSDRPYRRAYSPELALQELQAGAGTQWDSALVKTFVDALSAVALSKKQP